MPWRLCRLSVRAKGFLLAAFAIVLLFPWEQPRASQSSGNLQLDVVINGVPANMIGSFALFPGGMIGATEAELESIGLRGEASNAEEMVMLNDIPTLRYAYDKRKQRIGITVDDAWRLPRVFDLHSDVGLVRPRADWGTVLNYDVFSTLGGLQDPRGLTINGTSLTLDARALSLFWHV